MAPSASLRDELRLAFWVEVDGWAMVLAVVMSE
jgi:hypothetical protein